MNVQMSEEEKGLYFYLLNSPLFPDGVAPDWYKVLQICTRLRVAPWAWTGEEPTEAVKALWMDRILTATNIESDVHEIRRKNPDWFKNLSPMHHWLAEKAVDIGTSRILSWDFEEAAEV